MEFIHSLQGAEFLGGSGLGSPVALYYAPVILGVFVGAIVGVGKLIGKLRK